MPSTASEMPSVRRPVRAMLTLACIGVLATGCTAPALDRPFDVGNMAFPDPLPQGDLATTIVAGRVPSDIGNMAYPEPVAAGVVGRQLMPRRFFDTGNMAYPARQPVGDGPVTPVK